MKLLLKRDIPRLGIVGDVVNVAPGFARNYLLPQDLATQPTEANMRALADARREAEERRRLRQEKLQTAAEALADVEVTIEAAANEEGVLYGSVGPREVAAALRDLGHDINANDVHLRDPIKHLDNVMVPVVLAEKIEAQIKVWVVRSKAAIDDEQDGREAHHNDEDEYAEDE